MGSSIRAAKATIMIQDWTDRYRKRNGKLPELEVVRGKVNKEFKSLDDKEREYIVEHHQRVRLAWYA